MDATGGQLDEMASQFSLQIARGSAWESAVSLTNARNPLERQLASALITTRAATLARLLLLPLDPVLLAACRRLEAGPEWLTLLGAALA